MPSAPDIGLSVIVIGYAHASLLARCLEELRRQAAGRSGIEILVVAHRSHQGSSLDPVRDAFGEFRWLEAPPGHNVARLRGLGIARSTGRVVALLEGDGVPEEGWLARLAATSPRGAVGGAVEPGRFRRAVDWAAYFCEFARFMTPLPSVPQQLPGTNVAYRRSVLPDPARLEADGLYETFLNAELGNGAGLTTDSALIVRHGRTWRAGALLATRFNHGRGFAALRTRGTPAAQRAPYVALAVLLPPVLIGRVLAEVMRRRRLVGRAILALPWIAALSLSWSLGELAGYAFGAGSSLERWR